MTPRTSHPSSQPSTVAVTEATRLLRKIADLAYDEDVGEPLDCAIGYANKALAALSGPPVTTGEPVAFRWKPRLSSTWIYNPEKAWLDLQDPVEINIEPLYAAPTSGDVRAAVIEIAKKARKFSASAREGANNVEAMDGRSAAGTYEAFAEHFGGLANDLEATLSQSPTTDAAASWQPIETAPNDTNVLMAWKYEGIWEIKSGWAGSTKGGYLHSQATHWMPLPASPEISA